MSPLFRERLLLLPLISFVTELWHLLDVYVVAGHGAVLAALFKLQTVKKMKYKVVYFGHFRFVMNNDGI